VPSNQSGRCPMSLKRREPIHAKVLEIDATWGKGFRTLLEPLKKLEHELFAYIQLHIDAHLRGNTDLAKEYRKILKERRDILYDSLNDEEDDYRKEFLVSFKLVEEFLRGRLGRGLS
ncbi:MAG: hypothetical protein O3A08_11555, partial [Proteobacteria bacterium]|nr:hypothetical protein [Pseudomonadota bacterium]